MRRAIAFALCLAACGKPAAAPAFDDKPQSAKVTYKKDPAFAQCHKGFQPASNDQDLAADAAAMAKTCAETTKMHKLGETLTGQRAESDAPNKFPLKLAGGHCYRAYGVAETMLTDLNLLLRDGAGKVAGKDTNQDQSPVLLEDGAVCFHAADDATLEVTSGMGQGKFAIEVWSD